MKPFFFDDIDGYAVFMGLTQMPRCPDLAILVLTDENLMVHEASLSLCACARGNVSVVSVCLSFPYSTCRGTYIH